MHPSLPYSVQFTYFTFAGQKRPTPNNETRKGTRMLTDLILGRAMFLRRGADMGDPREHERRRARDERLKTQSAAKAKKAV